jgi:hypothetical protein
MMHLRQCTITGCRMTCCRPLREALCILCSVDCTLGCTMPMLKSGERSWVEVWILLCRMFTTAAHNTIIYINTVANALSRTAYLDKAVSSIISTIISNQPYNSTSQSTPINIRLIVMGGGYDTRSFKLIEHHLMHSDNTPSELLQRRNKQRISIWSKLFRRKKSNPLNALPSSNRYNLQCYELDLPEVVATKQKLIESRLSHRRPWLKKSATAVDAGTSTTATPNPTLIEADLNNLNQTQSILESILSSNNESNDGPKANIILFEGVMIYLDEGVPHSLLKLCSRVMRRHHSNTTSTSNYLCFADRLDNIPGGDMELAKAEMDCTGWILQDWLSKPGLARHMGYAYLK